MEFRGHDTDGRSKSRPAIARRACDQCRARKIGCDRGSPCSNCTSARLDCTHSAVASNAPSPKQRVLISAQYEQKIDGIARDIDGIKLLLQGLHVSLDEEQHAASPLLQLNRARSMKLPGEHQSVSAYEGETLWNHSAHIVDFVKAVVEDRVLRNDGPEASEMVSSLRNLVQALEGPASVRGPTPDSGLAKDLANPPMPPLEAVVAVLRWAKDHESNTRIDWISRILPLQKFTDICQKVYFAVDDYTEVDFILANGYLSYVFFEHVVVSGRRDYGEYCRLCRKNLHSALSRLPLLLPASMEVVAALTLGTYNAIENSQGTTAWTFISAAANLCQTLGYHRLRSSGENDRPLRAAQERLFWSMYKMERGLSHRLGRSSNIHDAEITLPVGYPGESRQVRLARIQGKVYDQLYSPTGLSRPGDERGHIAGALAGELRALIHELNGEISDAINHPGDVATDPMRVVYLRCDLICESSLLCLILRAIPMAANSLGGVLDECVAAARDALDIHDQCMRDVRACKNDSFMVTRYINWAILHCPFVPFSILFTRAVQVLDATDLARLDRFAASLQPDESASPESSITHPYRLYELLCQAGRLYFDSNATSSLTADPTLLYNLPDSLGELDFGMEVGTGILDVGGVQGSELSDWYYGNQQIMSLLDENAMF